MSPKSSIRVFPVVFLRVLPAAALALLAIWAAIDAAARNVLDQEIERRLESEAALLALNVGERFRTVVSAARAAAEDPRIVALVRDAGTRDGSAGAAVPASPPAIPPGLHLTSLEGAAITIVTRSGRVVAASAPPGSSTDRSTAMWIAGVDHGRLSVRLSGDGFRVVTPVMDAGNAAGALITTVPVSALPDLIALPPEAPALALVDATGTIIHTTTPAGDMTPAGVASGWVQARAAVSALPGITLVAAHRAQDAPFLARIRNLLLLAMLLALTVLAAGIILASRLTSSLASRPFAYLGAQLQLARQSGDPSLLPEVDASPAETRSLTASLRDLLGQLHDVSAAHEHTEHLLRTLPECLLVTSAKGTIELANPAACDLLGKAEDQLVGRSIAGIFAGTGADGAGPGGSPDAIPAGTVEHTERWITGSGGRRVPVLVSAGVARGAEDDEAIVFLMRDIGERKQAEEALRLSAERFELAALGANDGIWDWNLETDEVYYSARFKSLLGYEGDEPHEAIGSFMSRLHPEDAEGMRETIRKHLEDRRPFDVEYRFCTRSGEYRWFRTRGQAVWNDSGKAIRMAGSASDVTENQLAAGELREAKEAAETASRTKSEFLANMSHEIRTPMNGVLGAAGLLLDTPLSNEQREWAETIQRCADSLLGIVNDILDFSKIEAGKLVFEKVDFDLYEAVETLTDLFSDQLHSKDVELIISVDPDLPPAVCGDPGRLRQVLINLVNNALKFTNHGEVAVRVTRVEETETHLDARFSVRDTGIGIAPDVRPRLFRPFTQADGSTTRKYGGTGLGLAICKQLVEMMNGDIQVESELGEGSTFWFTARFEKPSESLVIAHTLAHSLEGARILIVDDNATSRQVLRYHAWTWGMLESVASNPVDALVLAERQAAAGTPYDVAILDMHMPDMDGMELARSLRSRPDTSGIRIILLTSTAQPPSADELKAAGIQRCLRKPVKYSKLREVVASVCSRQHGAPARVALPADDKQASGMRRKRRVLVVEDNIVNQKVAVRMLRKRGYAADAVANGLEALEALEQTPYDAVLMDCQMPEMDGYEATAEIRRREGTRSHIPIIAMTAHAMQGDREKCLAAGMDGYISKPVKVDLLEQVLEYHLAPEAARSAIAPRWLDVPRASGEVRYVDSEPAQHNGAAARRDLVPPIDLEPLRGICEDDPDALRELVETYFSQTSQCLQKLEVAIQERSATDVHFLAHSCKGASANCGMNPIAHTMRKLELMGRNQQLDGAEELFALALRQFAQIKDYLSRHLSPESVRE